MLRNVKSDGGLVGACIGDTFVQIKRDVSGLFVWTGKSIPNVGGMCDILILDSTTDLHRMVPEFFASAVLFIDIESVPDDYKYFYSDLRLCKTSTFRNKDVTLSFGRFKILRAIQQKLLSCRNISRMNVIVKCDIDLYSEIMLLLKDCQCQDSSSVGKKVYSFTSSNHVSSDYYERTEKSLFLDFEEPLNTFLGCF
jgi:hypothetical protein